MNLNLFFFKLKQLSKVRTYNLKPFNVNFDALGLDKKNILKCCNFV